jgi:hypothetical protein
MTTTKATATTTNDSAELNVKADGVQDITVGTEYQLVTKEERRRSATPTYRKRRRDQL